MTYTQVLNRSLELLDEEGPEAAYRFIKEEGFQVKNANEAQIYNFAYCFAALCGKTEEALGLLKEALYTKGYWYDYNYLMEDEDLKELRKYSEFETMAKLCQQRQQAALDCAKPVLVQDGIMKEKPSLLVLHGDQQNAAITLPYWQSAKEMGYALAAAQSTELQVSDGYLWDDEEEAAEEIKLHWNTLKEQDCDMENSILGGFSSGGRAAFYAAVTGAVNPKGLILVSPWLPELEEWGEDLSRLKAAGTKVYICCGDADEGCFEGSEELFELLDDNGIDVQFKLCPDLDHDYPEQFDELLKGAISFVQK